MVEPDKLSPHWIVQFDVAAAQISPPATVVRNMGAFITVFYDADGAMNNDIKVLMEIRGFNVQIAQYSTTFLRCTCESPTTALKSTKVNEKGVKLLHKRCSLEKID
jgi:hypothetical protein